MIVIIIVIIFAQITYWIRIIIPEGPGLGVLFPSPPPSPSRDLLNPTNIFRGKNPPLAPFPKLHGDSPYPFVLEREEEDDEEGGPL